MWKNLKSNWQLVIIIMVIIIVVVSDTIKALRHSNKGDYNTVVKDSTWIPPSLYADEKLVGKERETVIYGEDIIAHTSKYLGPHGSVAQITNGMNCQNCHLNAGRKNWGNNYSAVFSTYPKFRERSGAIETISFVAQSAKNGGAGGYRPRVQQVKLRCLRVCFV